MGYGRVGQHRKGGGRGGKGKAGGRKHLWIQTLKHDPDRYKKGGFKPPSALEPPLETINIGELKDLAQKNLGSERIENISDPIELDLTQLGINKLLGRGKIGFPLRLRVPSYTARAQEKVEAAGGVILESE